MKPDCPNCQVGNCYHIEGNSMSEELELDIETRIAIVEAGLLVAESMIRQLERKIDSLSKQNAEEPPF